MPQAWEVFCRSNPADDEIDPDDPTVLEFVEINKENGIQLTTMKEVRASKADQREQWRLAMQAEADSLRDNDTFQVATAEELRKVRHGEILPMKLVTGIKRDAVAGTEKKQVRAVVCGNFQRKGQNEDLYTSNADITSVRAVLAASVAAKHAVKVIDVKTAFLNAHLPDSMETVYVRPPQALIEFGLVAPGTIWRAVKAIYGLRISPKAWGVERDKELKRMTIIHNGVNHIFLQSHIDPSVWSIVPGDLDEQGNGRPTSCSNPAKAGVTQVVGWIVVYVDDFMIVGSNPVIDAATSAIKAKWRITDKPTVNFGSNESVEYLSVDIKAVPTGYCLSQPAYTSDLLAKWSMGECRALGSLEDVHVAEPDGEPDPRRSGRPSALPAASTG